MAEDDVARQRLLVLAVDDDVAERADTGVDAVAADAALDQSVDDPASVDDALACCIGKREQCAVATAAICFQVSGASRTTFSLMGFRPSLSALHEAGNIIVGRPFQNIVRCANLHHLAVLEDGDFRTDAQRLVEIMGDEDDGL